LFVLCILYGSLVYLGAGPVSGSFKLALGRCARKSRAWFRKTQHEREHVGDGTENQPPDRSARHRVLDATGPSRRELRAARLRQRPEPHEREDARGAALAGAAHRDGVDVRAGPDVEQPARLVEQQRARVVAPARAHPVGGSMMVLFARGKQGARGDGDRVDDHLVAQAAAAKASAAGPRSHGGGWHRYFPATAGGMIDVDYKGIF
jgi:hypothetical protein